MLKVTSPRPCDYICPMYEEFVLQCNFSSMPSFVVWILPHLDNVDLRNFQGHTVDSQFSRGYVNVRVISLMKFDTYVCNVVYPDGQLMASKRIEEGTTGV